MKKIITIAAFVLFSTVSANAIDFSGVSFTAGIASNTSVWGASAKETSSNESGTAERVNKEHGVFQDQFQSYFGETSAMPHQHQNPGIPGSPYRSTNGLFQVQRSNTFCPLPQLG